MDRAATLAELVEERDRVFAERSLELAREFLASAEGPKEAPTPEAIARLAAGAVIGADHDLAAELLWRAEQAAIESLADFEVWAHAPSAGFAVRDSLAPRAAVEADLRALLGEIRTAQMDLGDAAGRAALRAASLARFSNQRRGRLIDLVERALGDLLEAGELEAARALSVEVFESALPDPIRAEQVRDCATGDLDRLARIVRAQRGLGQPLAFGILPRIGRIGEHEVALLSAPRAAGDAAEAAHSTGRRRWKVEAVPDADQFRRVARGMLEWPGGTNGAGEPGALAPEVACFVPVEVSALRELLEQAPAAPAFREVAVLSRPHKSRQGVLDLWVAVRFGARVGARALEQVAIVAAGQTRSATVAGCRKAAVAFLASVGIGGVEISVVREWDGARTGAPVEEEALPVLSRPAFFGLDRCDHPGGRWDENEHKDALRLSCPRCRRRRIAVVPLHRLPEGHERHASRLAGDARKGYLARERFYRALAADPRPVETLEQLVGQDQSMSLDPGDYAIRTAPPERSDSLAGALSGRRATPPGHARAPRRAA